MNTREEFEKWMKSPLPQPDTGNELTVINQREMFWLCWQVATEASDAKWQARVKDLEEAFHLNMIRAFPEKSHEEVWGEIKRVSTSPDQTLQRVILDARIDENVSYACASIETIRERQKELRKQLAELKGE